MPLKRIRVTLYAILFVSLAGCAQPGAPRGDVDSIPKDTLVFNSDRSGNNELYLMKADGAGITRLTDNPDYENWWGRISPDRKKILYYRSPKGSPEDYEKACLCEYDYQSGTSRALRVAQEDNWARQGHAEWSPNGQKIAMFGGEGPFVQVFVTDAEGKNPVQYTNMAGYNTDVSWSPDGKKLVFNGYPTSDYARENYEIFVMDATANAAPVRLTYDGLADYDPYFSPDGSKIAWLVTVNPDKSDPALGKLGDWAIRIANADGSGAEYLIHDGNINSKPSWGPDGKTIFFHRMEYDPLVDYRFGIFSINVETRALSRLTQINTGSNEYPGN